MKDQNLSDSSENISDVTPDVTDEFGAILPWLDEKATLTLRMDDRLFHWKYHPHVHADADVNDDFVNSSADASARQLCVCEYELYCGVGTRELLTWSRSKAKETDCPKLSAFVWHFNRLSTFFTSLIVKRVYMEARVSVIIKMIDVCTALLQYGNYLAFQVCAVGSLEKCNI